MGKYKHEELIKDDSCKLYKIHIKAKKDKELEDVSEKIRKLALGRDKDEAIAGPFVCLWFSEEDSQRKSFDEMPKGSFIVYKENNKKGNNAVHIGKDGLWPKPVLPWCQHGGGQDGRYPYTAHSLCGACDLRDLRWYRRRSGCRAC